MSLSRLGWSCVLVALGGCAEEGDDWEASGEMAFRSCGMLDDTGLVGLSGVYLSGSPRVTGTAPTVFGNDVISLDGSVYVNGDLVTGGMVMETGTNTVTGAKVEGADPVMLPDPSADVEAARLVNDNASIPCIPYNGGTECRDAVVGGVLSLLNVDELILPAGVYYFEGMYVDGSAKLGAAGDVKIYLGGSASFNGATHSGSITLITADPSAVLSFNGFAHATVNVYAPHSTVSLTNDQRLTGAVVGKTVSLSSSAQMTTSGTIFDAFDLTCGDVLPELPDMPD